MLGIPTSGNGTHRECETSNMDYRRAAKARDDRARAFVFIDLTDFEQTWA